MASMPVRPTSIVRGMQRATRLWLVSAVLWALAVVALIVSATADDMRLLRVLTYTLLLGCALLVTQKARRQG